MALYWHLIRCFSLLFFLFLMPTKNCVILTYQLQIEVYTPCIDTVFFKTKHSFLQWIRCQASHSFTGSFFLSDGVVDVFPFCLIVRALFLVCFSSF